MEEIAVWIDINSPFSSSCPSCCIRFAIVCWRTINIYLSWSSAALTWREASPPWCSPDCQACPSLDVGSEA